MLILKLLMAKRVRVPEARSLFIKNVMLAPCVTPSIYCSVLSFFILIVVVAFSSCLVIALQKKHESASIDKSSRLLHYPIWILFKVNH